MPMADLKPEDMDVTREQIARRRSRDHNVSYVDLSLICVRVNDEHSCLPVL